jgi:hypothetical protein
MTSPWIPLTAAAFAAHIQVQAHALPLPIHHV